MHILRVGVCFSLVSEAIATALGLCDCFRQAEPECLANSSLHSFAVEFRNTVLVFRKFEFGSGDHPEGADVASLLNLEGAEMQAYKIAIRQLSGLARESFFDEKCGSNVWSQI